jgi:hypothetical protein
MATRRIFVLLLGLALIFGAAPASALMGGLMPPASGVSHGMSCPSCDPGKDDRAMSCVDACMSVAPAVLMQVDLPAMEAASSRIDPAAAGAPPRGVYLPEPTPPKPSTI